MCSHERVGGQYLIMDKVSLQLLSLPPTVRRAPLSVVVLEYMYGTSGSVFQTDCCLLLFRYYHSRYICSYAPAQLAGSPMLPLSNRMLNIIACGCNEHRMPSCS